MSNEEPSSATPPSEGQKDPPREAAFDFLTTFIHVFPVKCVDVDPMSGSAKCEKLPVLTDSTQLECCMAILGKHIEPTRDAVATVLASAESMWEQLQRAFEQEFRRNFTIHMITPPSLWRPADFKRDSEELHRAGMIAVQSRRALEVIKKLHSIMADSVQ